jgi:hypothetical protein
VSFEAGLISQLWCFNERRGKRTIHHSTGGTLRVRPIRRHQGRWERGLRFLVRIESRGLEKIGLGGASGLLLAFWIWGAGE